MAAARPDTWMPIYWGDYLRDTMHLRAEGHGAYLLLIAHYWTSGEPLPDDDDYLMAVARMDSKQWTKVRPLLERFFDLEDGTWRHGRIDQELDKATRITEARQKAGKTGGKRSADTRANQQANGEAKPKQTVKQNPTPSQPPSPETIPAAVETPPPRDAAVADLVSETEPTPDPVPDNPKAEPGRDYAAEADEMTSVGKRVLEICGWDEARRPPDYLTVRMWLNGKYSPDLHIYPAVERVTQQQRQKTPGWVPNSLNYFTPAIREAFQTEATNIPPFLKRTADSGGYVPKTDPEINGATLDTWRRRVERWRKSPEDWMSVHGLPPNESGTLVPREILDEFKIGETEAAE